MEHQFHAKASKCLFGATSIPFLGHIISDKGVQADPKKLVAIQQWPTPSSFTHLRAFLGLTGYYRRFVPNYANIASSLTDTLKQSSFTWNVSASEAFNNLKQAMSQLLTIALPKFLKPFDVTTDASGVVVGAVLSQKDKPILFFSKKLCEKMLANSTYIRELYAITEAIKKWRQYLLGRKFRVYTDHHSLKHLLTQTVQTPEQHKWLTKLMGYDFELHYKPGKNNRVADALSRPDQARFMAVSTPTAEWLHELRNYYTTTQAGQKCSNKYQKMPCRFTLNMTD
uniref:Reverse transcriptase n=1 Tax=Tanacetum cinerariifolium TaxID=118510 RepID=A0A6L2M2E1_TANCI|nr:reverse transcriptase [Tanacetum cinerariifolium]